MGNPTTRFAIGEAPFIKANAAFDRAVRETGATQLQSAYHNVKERVVATSSSIMPSVFASATTVKTDVQAKDTGSDVVDFDPITAELRYRKKSAISDLNRIF